MSKNLYFISVSGWTGKTALMLGLGLKLKKEGKKVGYFKPFSRQTGIREDGSPINDDTLLMKECLSLEEDETKISPFVLPPQYLVRLLDRGGSEVWEEIEDSLNEISSGKDIVLIEGPGDPFVGAFLGLSAPIIAKKLDCDVVLVSRPTTSVQSAERILDEFIGITEIFISAGTAKERIGAVINQTPPEVEEVCRGTVGPQLTARGIKCFGIIHEHKDLISPTVGEIHQEIGGQILIGEKFLDRLVEDFMIGAMKSQAALKFFRRSVNKAVVTGGDRADIVLAALETSTSVVILTGNLHPDVSVITAAREKGVPLLLVPYDTRTTLEKLDAIPWRIRSGNKTKIESTLNVVENHLDWKAMIE